MNRLTLSALLMTLAMFSVAQAARAEDFNITIPLELSNLPPNIDGMLLACRVYTADGRNTGIGRKRVDISGGAYRGSTTLNFNVEAGQDPSLITRYECLGSFVGNESGATVHYFTDGGIHGTRFPLAAGAPFRMTTGTLALPR